MIKNKHIDIFYLGLLLYIITIVLSYVMFSDQLIYGYWFVTQSILILYFFGGVVLVYRSTISINPARFITSVILLNILIKSVALLFSFFYFKSIFGIGIIDHSDYYSYYINSLYFSTHISDFGYLINDISLSDIGGFIYYTLIYFIFGDNIFMAGIVNMFFAIHSIVLMYKIIKLVNTEKVARITVIVMSLIPILNYYIGLHLKELIFIWLILMGIYYLYKSFSKKTFSFWMIATISVVVVALFLFRTVVGLIFIVSIISYFLFSGSFKLHTFYRIFSLIILFGGVLVLFLLSSAGEETEKYYNAMGSEETIMEAGVVKAQRTESVINSFMNLPSKLFMTINSPYPNLVEYNLSEEDKIMRYSQLADAFIKGFLAFFFFLSIIDISFLRKNIFMSSFVFMYLTVISIGGMSLLYRMFLPVLPIFIYFSVAQITKMNKTKYLVLLGYLMVMIFIYLYFNHAKMVDYKLY